LSLYTLRSEDNGVSVFDTNENNDSPGDRLKIDVADESNCCSRPDNVVDLEIDEHIDAALEGKCHPKYNLTARNVRNIIHVKRVYMLFIKLIMN